VKHVLQYVNGHAASVEHPWIHKAFPGVLLVMAISQQTQPTSEQSHENHTIPDVLLWRGSARYGPHLTDMQEPSGIERRDMAITNNTPGKALWIHGCSTEAACPFTYCSTCFT
jgi:hypothetical protein